jgi:hypothetical protein
MLVVSPPVIVPHDVHAMTPLALAADWWPFRIPRPRLAPAADLRTLLDELVRHCERLYWAGVLHGATLTAAAFLALYLLHRLRRARP